MKRSHFLGGTSCCLALAITPAIVSAAGDTYDLVTSTGTIRGTLTLPVRVTKPDVVLLIAGSGPTDRNGNGPGLRTDAYLLLADALAQEGVASVRFDKRGIGASVFAMTAETDLRFDNYVCDAAAWLVQLRQDPRFGKIVVAGHSEGSLIGMIAAHRVGAGAFVSLDGAGRPAADVIRAQMQTQLATSPDLAAANERILAELTKGRTTKDVPAALNALYRQSVQPYLISWFRYDPRVEIAKLDMPVRIVQGTSDLQVPVDDAKALAAACPRATLVLVKGMSHVLKHAGGKTLLQQEQTVYADPSIPIEPLVTQTIVSAAQSTHHVLAP